MAEAGFSSSEEEVVDMIDGMAFCSTYKPKDAENFAEVG